MMLSAALTERLLAWLRVPPTPSAPAGDEDTRVFRAAPGYFRYRLLAWLTSNIGGAIGLALALSFSSGLDRVLLENTGNFGLRLSTPFLLRLIWLFEAGAVVVFIAQALGRLALLRLDFDQRWYLVSDRSLRIREGLLRLQEKTMTMANIQNVSIRQGPLQRWFGIADLEVRTAGGGGHSGGEEGEKSNMHVAYFKGIDNAEEVRAIIRERLRSHRDAGLGDPDDHVHRAATPQFGTLAIAARALADETRALAATLRVR